MCLDIYVVLFSLNTYQVPLIVINHIQHYQKVHAVRRKIAFSQLSEEEKALVTLVILLDSESGQVKETYRCRNCEYQVRKEGGVILFISLIVHTSVRQWFCGRWAEIGGGEGPFYLRRSRQVIEL